MRLKLYLSGASNIVMRDINLQDGNSSLLTTSTATQRSILLNGSLGVVHSLWSRVSCMNNSISSGHLRIMTNRILLESLTSLGHKNIDMTTSTEDYFCVGLSLLHSDTWFQEQLLLCTPESLFLGGRKEYQTQGSDFLCRERRKTSFCQNVSNTWIPERPSVSAKVHLQLLPVVLKSTFAIDNFASGLKPKSVSTEWVTLPGELLSGFDSTAVTSERNWNAMGRISFLNHVRQIRKSIEMSLPLQTRVSLTVPNDLMYRLTLILHQQRSYKFATGKPEWFWGDCCLRLIPVLRKCSNQAWGCEPERPRK